MATISTTYAASATSLTITLNSLANAASATSSVVDNNTTAYLDALLMVKIVTAASGVSATGTVDLYIQASIDNTNFEDTKNDKLVTSVVADAANLTGIRVQSIAACYGGVMPTYWRLRVVNNSGAALAASGHSASFRGITATSV